MLNFCLNCGNDEIGTSKFCFHCGSELSDIETVNIFPPDTLLDGRYKIISLLREIPPFVRDSTSHIYKIQYLLKEFPGGIVYIAEDIRFKNMCLVKEIVFNYEKTNVKAYTETLRNKIKIFSNIRHPSVPAVTNYFVHKGRHYLVMDYFKGKSFQEILREEGKPGIAQKNVISWAMQILDLLDYVHNQNIVYRNISPDIIMIKDSDKRIILLDLYLSSPDVTDTGKRILPAGKYSAPEEVKGTFGARSDLFSIGATMYYLLTGREENFTEGKIKPLKEVLPVVHPSLERIINTSLSSDPEKRYPSASYMKKELFKTSRIEVKKAEEEKKKEKNEEENIPCEVILKKEIPHISPESVPEPVNMPHKKSWNILKIFFAFLITISIISFYLIINRYMTENIFNDGVMNLKKAIDGKKTYCDSLGKLGYTTSTGDYKKAIEDFHDCIKRKENHYRAYYMIGHAFYGLYEIELLRAGFEGLSPSSENLNKAIDNYKKALFYNPHCPEASYYLARCYYHLGDMEKSRGELDNTEKICLSGNKKTFRSDKIDSAKKSFLNFNVGDEEKKSYATVEFINETDITISLDFKGKDFQSLSLISKMSQTKNFKPGEYIYTVKFKETSFQDKVIFEARRFYRLNLKEIHDTFVEPDL